MAKRIVVVDGSNMAYLDQTKQKPTIKTLKLVIAKLHELDIEPVVYVDAALKHKIDEPALLEQTFREGIAAEAPRGVEADRFILQEAERLGVPVVSNDWYEPYRERHPWLAEKGRLVKAMLSHGRDTVYFEPEFATEAPTDARSADEVFEALKQKLIMAFEAAMKLSPGDSAKVKGLSDIAPSLSSEVRAEANRMWNALWDEFPQESPIYPAMRRRIEGIERAGPSSSARSEGVTVQMRKEFEICMMVRPYLLPLLPAGFQVKVAKAYFISVMPSFVRFARDYSYCGSGSPDNPAKWREPANLLDWRDVGNDFYFEMSLLDWEKLWLHYGIIERPLLSNIPATRLEELPFGHSFHTGLGGGLGTLPQPGWKSSFWGNEKPDLKYWYPYVPPKEREIKLSIFRPNANLAFGKNGVISCREYFVGERDITKHGDIVQVVVHNKTVDNLMSRQISEGQILKFKPYGKEVVLLMTELDVGTSIESPTVPTDRVEDAIWVASSGFRRKDMVKDAIGAVAGVCGPRAPEVVVEVDRHSEKVLRITPYQQPPPGSSLTPSAIIHPTTGRVFRWGADLFFAYLLPLVVFAFVGEQALRTTPAILSSSSSSFFGFVMTVASPYWYVWLIVASYVAYRRRSFFGGLKLTFLLWVGLSFVSLLAFGTLYQLSPSTVTASFGISPWLELFSIAGPLYEAISQNSFVPLLVPLIVFPLVLMAFSFLGRRRAGQP